MTNDNNKRAKKMSNIKDILTKTCEKNTSLQLLIQTTTFKRQELNNADCSVRARTKSSRQVYL